MNTCKATASRPRSLNDTLNLKWLSPANATALFALEML